MKTLNDAVKTLLQEQAFWYVATCDGDGTPHLITTLFKAVLPDGRLAIARNFMKTTVENAKRSGKVTIGVGKFPQPEGYQIICDANFAEEGPVVEQFKAVVSEKTGGRMVCTGALILTPSKVIVNTPGPDNGKEI
jgi:predicted pyridoxine 5'-phosphate oxidase superfamily flavin-nucleotide-binding protein